MLEVTDCPVCGEKPVAKFDNCPNCGTRPRIRTLFPLMQEVIAPLVKRHPEISVQPALGFAMTKVEKQQLGTSFPLQKSASLHGNYGEDHEEGVDIRDLSRYQPNSFSSVFGVLIFDYFEEHMKALQESYRVLAPGGILFTHITPSRLHDSDVPPRLDAMLVPRSDFLSYVPAEKGLPSVHVGRKWFVNAMREVGFDAENHQIRDAASQKNYDWFVGVKPYA